MLIGRRGQEIRELGLRSQLFQAVLAVSSVSPSGIYSSNDVRRELQANHPDFPDRSEGSTRNEYLLDLVAFGVLQELTPAQLSQAGYVVTESRCAHYRLVPINSINREAYATLGFGFAPVSPVASRNTTIEDDLRDENSRLKNKNAALLAAAQKIIDGNSLVGEGMRELTLLSNQKAA